MEFHPKQLTAAGRSARCANCMLLVAMLLTLALVGAAQPAAAMVSVTDVRFWSVGDVTRIAIETTGKFEFKYQTLSNPPRIYYDIQPARKRVGVGPVTTMEVDDGRVLRIRIGQNQLSVTRIVVDLAPMTTVTASKLENPNRLMLEARGPGFKPSELSRNEPFSPPEDTPRAPALVAASPPASEIIEKSPVRPARLESQAETPPARPDTPVEKAAPPPPRPRVTLARIEKPKAEVSSHPEVANTPEDPQPSPAAEIREEPAPELQAAETGTPKESDDDSDDDSVVATPAKSNNGGGHSLTRALGLKLGRVVIDPGHGGRDTGTIGPTGLREKEVTLDVAKRLAELIRSGLGSEVVLTRTDDSKVSLTERNERANKEQADLFVSIHVNSSRYRSVNGVETFYLNLTRSRADLEVAARENAGSDKSIHELSTLVEKIAMDDKLQESRDLAFQVQSAVHALALKHDPKARNRGVKKAPFVVLIGAQMPSVLVELGFISNPDEEQLLKSSDYRQQLAEALYKGIARYASSLSHFEVARTGDE